MPNIEKRLRKDGSTAHVLRWVDKKTGKRKTQRFDEVKDAEFMMAVLAAHDLDTSLALSSAQKHFAAAYTVTKMVEDHIDLLTNANGYTIKRYKGQLTNHISPTIGRIDVLEVGYRDVVNWVKGMSASGSSSKTIANVHGLLSSAFKTAVKDKRRLDNPCAGVSLPRNSATEDAMSFLTSDEWSLLQSHIPREHRPLFDFLLANGVRFSEATALHARDFSTDRNGQVSVRIVRAWTRTESNQPVIGPPKTKKCRRTIHVATRAGESVVELIRASRTTGEHVFLSQSGKTFELNRAWKIWNKAVKSAQVSTHGLVQGGLS